MIDEKDVNRHRQPFIESWNILLFVVRHKIPMYFSKAVRPANKYPLESIPEIVEATMQKFEQLTGRSYKLFEYYGHPHAENIIVIMGSGSGPVHEITDYLNNAGEKVGYLHVHLYPSILCKAFYQCHYQKQ